MGFKDVVDVVRARKWLILLCVLVVTVLTLAVSLTRPPSYQGEAQVLLTQRSAGATILGAPQSQVVVQPAWDVATQVQVIQSRPILERVVRTLNLGTTPEALLRNVSVEAAGQTNIVTIGVTDRSAKRAADIANAIAVTYVASSADAERANYKATADEVAGQLATATVQIGALELNAVALQNLPAHSHDASIVQNAIELQVAKVQYEALADKLNQLRTNEHLAVGSGSVLASAAPNPSPVSLSPLRTSGIALALGLVFGLGVAFVATVLDNTVRSSEVAEEIYGAPVLGQVPFVRAHEKHTPVLTLIRHPGSPEAEAYRSLRNNLGFVNFQHNIKTILITSAAPSEGKSTVAANLATVLSQAGKTVILVDCDFHRPTAAAFFEVEAWVGLSDILTGKMDLRSVFQAPPELDRLRVVPAGTIPPNPSELLASSTFSDVIKTLRDRADWIILDSAPLLAVADAAAVANSVDGVLVVSRVGTSTLSAARKAAQQLRNVGANIIGVVLMGLETAEERQRQYGYTGYTTNGETAPAPEPTQEPAPEPTQEPAPEPAPVSE